MPQVWTVVVTIVGLLLLERLAIGFVTRSPARRAWIAGCRLLHPNTISVVRIPMGLVTVGLWLADWQTCAILWFAVWMISDLTDGTIARNCDLTTETGKWLDPLSDKCMYYPPLILFAVGRAQDRALDPAWVAALILVDSVGQASRLFARKKAANHFGKAKTALITILLSLTALKALSPAELHAIGPKVLYFMTLSATILSFLSFYCKVVPDTWYANSLTLANFGCGLGAIASVFAGHPMRAFVLVFVGQFFDLFDGRLARKYGSTRYGAIYDDIADGTSFGGAIGLLVWDCLDRTPAAAAVAVLYLICVIYRLIRFVKPPFPMPRGIFLGFPSPAGALLAGSIVLTFGEWPWLAYPGVVLTSWLMVSSIRYRHFGQLIWPTLPNTVRLLGFVLFLVFVDISLADKEYRVAFAIFCLLLSASYGVYGLSRFGRPDDPADATPDPTDATPGPAEGE